MKWIPVIADVVITPGSSSPSTYIVVAVCVCAAIVSTILFLRNSRKKRK